MKIQNCAITIKRGRWKHSFALALNFHHYLIKDRGIKPTKICLVYTAKISPDERILDIKVFDGKYWRLFEVTAYSVFNDIVFTIQAEYGDITKPSE